MSTLSPTTITTTTTPDDADLITHEGIFHGDEVMAAAIVAISNIGTETRVLRTRDQGIIAAFPGLVVDVGGVFDGVLRLDHHMREGGPAPRANGVPYSGAGLTWERYGFLACTACGVAALHGTEVASRVGEELIELIDAVDCGQASGTSHLRGNPDVKLPVFGFSAIVSGFNPVGATPAASDEAFALAATTAMRILRNVILAVDEERASAERVRDAIRAVGADAPVVVLDAYEAAAGDVLAEDSEALYFVFPGTGGTFMVQQVPVEPGAMAGRKSLPEPWGGLRGSDLDAVTGIAGGVFCHPGRFIGGHETLEGATKMAHLAVEA